MKFQLLATASLALFLAGCGTTVRGRVSAPLGEEKWTKKDYDWELREEAFFLTVGSANFRKDGKPFEADYLPIWIRIKPLVDGVTFDPYQVTLSSESVTDLSPAWVHGPYPAKEVAFREAAYEIYFDLYHGTPDYVYVRGVADD